MRLHSDQGLAATIRVGVSGFSYPAWRGKFYPKEAKSEDLLVEYARRLDSVEINSSFYGAPRQDTIKSWATRTGEDFRIAFKAPRQITHISKLGPGSVEAANRFFESLNPMGPRLGPILFQLPPFLKRDLKLLEGFLVATESIEGRVFEFRNQSWIGEATYELLRRHHAGFCIAETEDMEPVFRVTSDDAYFRLRRDVYDAKAIDPWAGRIAETAKMAKQTYVFLRHDETGENAVLAQRLAQRLR
jgi:uncharacterized protein YecE (DUF72 family)